MISRNAVNETQAYQTERHLQNACFSDIPNRNAGQEDLIKLFASGLKP